MRGAAGSLRRSPSLPAPLALGAAIVTLILICAVAPGVIAPYDPFAFDYTALLAPPGAAHLFGADNFGRDILSRVIYASRVDIQIALFATLGPLVVGSLVGLLAAFFGGWPDILLGRVIDLVLTFPFLVIVIAIVAVIGPGLFNLYVAVTLVGWGCSTPV